MIGILTFHRAVNYGAILQAYALECVIKKLGYECELIDYRNSFIEQSYAPTPITCAHDVKALIKTIVYNDVKKRKRSKFQRFLSKSCSTSCPIFSENDFLLLQGRYDVIIAGSDQIWNLSLSDEDYQYFLESFDARTRKCAYAASISIDGNGWTKAQIARILSDLQKFDAISVRETAAKNYLTSIGLRSEIEVVLDPILLLTKEDWMIQMPQKNIPGIPGKYLLVYFIAQNQENYSAARRIAAQMGLTAVLINYTPRHMAGFVNLKTVSPKQFLRLVAEADYFITDSFHGVAFSVLFKKDFVYRLNPVFTGMNDRIETLTNALGLSCRNYAAMCSDQRWNRINNWDEIQEKLSALQRHSIKYLTEKVLI